MLQALQSQHPLGLHRERFEPSEKIKWNNTYTQSSFMFLPMLCPALQCVDKACIYLRAVSGSMGDPMEGVEGAGAANNGAPEVRVGYIFGI